LGEIEKKAEEKLSGMRGDSRRKWERERMGLGLRETAL